MEKESAIGKDGRGRGGGKRCRREKRREEEEGEEYVYVKGKVKGREERRSVVEGIGGTED